MPADNAPQRPPTEKEAPIHEISSWLSWRSPLFLLPVTIGPKLYITSTINIWKKLLSIAIWANENRLVFGRIVCISSKNLRSETISIAIYFNAEFIQLYDIFMQINWKVKGIIHDFNHDLTFYCTHINCVYQSMVCINV